MSWKFRLQQWFRRLLGRRGAQSVSRRSSAKPLAVEVSVLEGRILLTTQPPIGTSTTMTVAENTPFTFHAVDFGFTDPNNSPSNSFANVEITTLPANGTLKNNGSAVTVGQFVSVSNITSGNLVYTPPTNATGLGYASFTFQVQSNGSSSGGGVNVDPNPKTMTVNVSSLPVASGSETLVNTYTTSNQANPSVASDAAGDYVVTWESSGQSSGTYQIYAQRFNAAGVAQGSEFQVNNVTTNGNQTTPKVAMDAAGDFVIVWGSTHTTGGTSGQSVFARRYNASGTAVGNQFTVGSNSTNFVSVAMDSQGDFLVAWTEQANYYGIQYSEVVAQRYTSSGATAGTKLYVSGNYQYSIGLNAVSVGMGQAGDATIVWDGNLGVYAQRYNSAGATQGARLSVGLQKVPAIAMDAAGDFVVAWQKAESGNGDGVVAQRYNSSGVKQGSQLQVNATVTGNQQLPAVSMDTAGDFVISWQSASQDGSGYGIYAEAYTSAGAVQKSEFLVNTTTSGNQKLPAVAMNSTGNFIVAWESAAQDGSGYGIYSQRYTVAPAPPASPNVAPTITVPGGTQTTSSNGSSVVSGLSFGDTDALGGNETVTLAVAHGTLTLNTGVASGLTSGQITGNGTASVSITAPLAAINATLANSTGLTYATTLTSNGSDTLSVGINDNGNSGTGGLLTASNSVPITVIVNQAPVLSGTASHTYTENASPVVVNGTIVVTDSDNSTLANAAIAISNYASGEDLLNFTNAGSSTMGNIAGSFNSSTGVLTLSSPGATATVAQWQTALQSVAYSNSSDNPSTFTRNVTIQVNDGQAVNSTSNIVTNTVAITAVNDAPTVTSSNQTTPEDVVLAISGLSFADADAGTSNVTVTLVVSHGVLTLSTSVSGGLTSGQISGNGSNSVTITAPLAAINATLADSSGLAYLPTANYNGSDTLAVSINDGGNTGTGGAKSASANVGITITAVNDPPVMGGSFTPLTVLEDSHSTYFGWTGMSFTSGGGSDESSQTLTYTITALPSSLFGTINTTYGVAVILGNTYTLNDIRQMVFATATNANGTGTFTFSVKDSGGIANGGNDTLYVSNTITVTAVNDRPVLVGSAPALQMREDAETRSLGLSSISFTPGPSDESSQTLTYTVTSVPAASLGTIKTSTGETVTAGTPYSWADIGAMTFTPALNANGSSALVISVQDNGGTANGGMDTLSFSQPIIVVAVNDPPVQAGSFSPLTVFENTSTTSLGLSGISFTPGPSDESSQTLTYTVTAIPSASLGTIVTSTGGTVATGTVYSLSDIQGMTFTPTANAFGNGTFAFNVRDSGDVNNDGNNTLPVSLAIHVDEGLPALANLETVNYAYIVGAPAATLTSTLTISDLRSTTLTSATVQIDQNYVSTEDVLSFTDTGTITGNWNSTTGTLTLTGTDTLANYQAALRTITYQNTNSNPYAPARRFKFVVNDGLNDSHAANRTFTLTSPFSNIETTDIQYTENDPATTITSTLTVASNVTLTGAMVRFNINYTFGEDILTYTQVGNIVGSWNATTATLTLSGSDTTANYQAALRSVKYQNISENPRAIVRRFQFAAITSGIPTVAVTRQVNVVAINDAPTVLAPTSKSTLQNTPVVIPNISFNDVDGGTANETVTLSDSHGLLTLSSSVTNGLTAAQITGNGTATVTITAPLSKINATLADAHGLTYASPPSFNGSDSLSIQINDNGNTGTGGAKSATSPPVNLTVTAVNQAPTGTSTTITVNENVAYVFSSADFGFADPNDSPANSLLAVKITTVPGSGTLFDNGNTVHSGDFVSAADLGNGKLVFSATTNTFGTNYSSFTFQVQDNGGTANGGADLDPVLKTIAINVTSMNRAPIGTGNTVTTLEDTPYLFQASDFGFTDPNDNPANSLLAVTITTLPGAGTLANNGTAVIAGQSISVTDINSGHLVFAPSPNANGTNYASFAFQVQDNGGTLGGGSDTDSTPRTLAVSVTPVNDAPVLSGLSTLAYTANDAATVVNPVIAVTDVDNATLAGATVTITNYVSAEDLLSFTANPTTMGNITASFNSGTGAMSLVSSGATATLAQWQSALQAVKYTNSSSSPTTTSRTVAFAVDDGQSANHASQAIVSTINLTTDTNPPLLSTSSHPTYVMFTAPIPVNPLISVSDPGSPTLASASVNITNYVFGEDLLGFANDGSTMGNVAASFNTTLGTLTLTSPGATATVAQWQAALRAVLYADVAGNPNTSTRNVTIAVSDGRSAHSTSNSLTNQIDVSLFPPAPQITGLSDNSGTTLGGTSVTIAGTGFSHVSAVMFGSREATSFTINSDTSITAISPAHVAGSVDVMVVAPLGSSDYGLSDRFTYQKPIGIPTVTSVTPGTATTTGGATITIAGTNFTNVSSVEFGGVPATGFTVNSPTSITATAPVHISGQADVQVVNDNGPSDTNSHDVLIFTIPTLTPMVTQLSQTTGSASGGTCVTILGAYFTDVTNVMFGNVAATSFTVTSPTSITAIAPALAAGTVDITVINSAGTSSTSSSDEFTFQSQMPTVTGLSTTVGSISGGTQVVIGGTNFIGVTSVMFGSVAATSFSVDSDGVISAIAPAESAGTVHITVQSSNGISTISAADQFTFAAPAPFVTGLSVSSGLISGSTSVIISGTGLSNATGVLFGSTAASSYIINTDGTITAISPAGQLGTVDIRVTSAGGTSAATWGDRFQFTNPAPAVTGVSSAADPNGGTLVTVSGSHFIGTTTVKFGTVSVSNFTIYGDNTISVHAPAGTVGAMVDLTVQNPAGTSAVSSADQFTFTTSGSGTGGGGGSTFTPPPPPMIEGLTVFGGSTAGGESITILGTTLDTVTSVMFGSVPATSFQINSDASITAIAPAEVAGTVNIVLIGTGGTSTSSSAGKYTFTDPSAAPSITGFTFPNSSATQSVVTINGTGFTGATRVSFGTTPAVFVVSSPTTILAVVPNGISGTQNVSVTNSHGASMASPNSLFSPSTTPPVSTGSKYVIAPTVLPDMTNSLIVQTQANLLIGVDGGYAFSSLPVITRSGVDGELLGFGYMPTIYDSQDYPLLNVSSNVNGPNYVVYDWGSGHVAGVETSQTAAGTLIDYYEVSYDGDGISYGNTDTNDGNMISHLHIEDTDIQVLIAANGTGYTRMSTFEETLYQEVHHYGGVGHVTNGYQSKTTYADHEIGVSSPGNTDTITSDSTGVSTMYGTGVSTVADGTFYGTSTVSQGNNGNYNYGESDTNDDPNNQMDSTVGLTESWGGDNTTHDVNDASGTTENTSYSAHATGNDEYSRASSVTTTTVAPGAGTSSTTHDTATSDDQGTDNFDYSLDGTTYRVLYPYPNNANDISNWTKNHEYTETGSETLTKGNTGYLTSTQTLQDGEYIESRDDYTDSSTDNSGYFDSDNYSGDQTSGLDVSAASSTDNISFSTKDKVRTTDTSTNQYGTQTKSTVTDDLTDSGTVEITPFVNDRETQGVAGVDVEDDFAFDDPTHEADTATEELKIVTRISGQVGANEFADTTETITCSDISPSTIDLTDPGTEVDAFNPTNHSDVTTEEDTSRDIEQTAHTIRLSDVLIGTDTITSEDGSVTTKTISYNDSDSISSIADINISDIHNELPVNGSELVTDDDPVDNKFSVVDYFTNDDRITVTTTTPLPAGSRTETTGYTLKIGDGVLTEGAESIGDQNTANPSVDYETDTADLVSMDSGEQDDTYSLSETTTDPSTGITTTIAESDNYADKFTDDFGDSTYDRTAANQTPIDTETGHTIVTDATTDDAGLAVGVTGNLLTSFTIGGLTTTTHEQIDFLRNPAAEDVGGDWEDDEYNSTSIGNDLDIDKLRVFNKETISGGGHANIAIQATVTLNGQLQSLIDDSETDVLTESGTFTSSDNGEEDRSDTNGAVTNDSENDTEYDGAKFTPTEIEVINAHDTVIVVDPDTGLTTTVTYDNQNATDTTTGLDIENDTDVHSQSLTNSGSDVFSGNEVVTSKETIIEHPVETTVVTGTDSHGDTYNLTQVDSESDNDTYIDTDNDTQLANGPNTEITSVVHQINQDVSTTTITGTVSHIDSATGDKITTTYNDQSTNTTSGTDEFDETQVTGQASSSNNSTTTNTTTSDTDLVVYNLNATVTETAPAGTLVGAAGTITQTGSELETLANGVVTDRGGPDVIANQNVLDARIAELKGQLLELQKERGFAVQKLHNAAQAQYDYSRRWTGLDWTRGGTYSGKLAADVANAQASLDEFDSQLQTTFGFTPGKAHLLAGDDALYWSYGTKFLKALQYAYDKGLFEGEIKSQIHTLLDTLQDPAALAQFIVVMGGIAMLKKQACKGPFVPVVNGLFFAKELADSALTLSTIKSELDGVTFESEIGEAAPRIVNFMTELVKSVAFAELMKRIKCFIAGTQVVVASDFGENGVAHYTTRNIEDIQVGDWVLARDEFGENVQLRRVNNKFKRVAFALQSLSFAHDSGRSQTLFTTEEHPFWVANLREFRAAYQLNPGDRVTGPDGQLQNLASSKIESHPEGVFVYNFTVDIAHTYFVCAVSNCCPILVHNADGYADEIGSSPNNPGSTFRLPQTWRSGKGVSGTFSDGKHTFRIDTNNLSPGERFHVHVYSPKGQEIAVVQGIGTNGIWRESHRGRTLLKPSEVAPELRTDIRRLLRNALNNLE